ncbi:hypothetical protein ALI144C_44920 [Actinosynnema sp. ALI-1.44]|nr:hypothetical protein ALI144C_44920 [Actinosynnema sp. ALI-1.44]
MSRSWSGGSTRAWRRIRARVLARDGHRCQVQLDGCTLTATEVHHTRGRAITGDDERYLVASCKPCNLKIGDPSKRDPSPTPHSSW